MHRESWFYIQDHKKEAKSNLFSMNIHTQLVQKSPTGEQKQWGTTTHRETTELCCQPSSNSKSGMCMEALKKETGRGGTVRELWIRNKENCDLFIHGYVKGGKKKRKNWWNKLFITKYSVLVLCHWNAAIELRISRMIMIGKVWHWFSTTCGSIDLNFCGFFWMSLI